MRYSDAATIGIASKVIAANRIGAASAAKLTSSIALVISLT